MNTEKTVNTLIKDYSEQMDAKSYVQKNTLWVLSRFVTWMVVNRVDVRNPRRADIIHYKNDLINEGKTPTTVKRYLSSVRSFFNYLEKESIYENVSAGIKAPKDERDFRKDYLNPAQVIQLLDSIQLNRITGLRDYAMINLMLCTGLRRVEVLRLTVGDVSQTTGGTVLNIRRKGRIYKEHIRIENEVFEPIEQYLTARTNLHDTQPLFANHSRWTRDYLSAQVFSQIVKKYLKQLPSDSKQLTCHSLRHSAAINLINAGKSIYDVSLMLGHTSVETTQLYLKAVKAERSFNNPVGRDLVQLYQNRKKTAITAPDLC